MTTIALTGETARADFAARPNAALIAAECGAPVLDVVVPVYNEEATLADSVRRPHRHLSHDSQFQHYVADGQIRYFIHDDSGRRGGNHGDPSSGCGAAGQITKWVAANFIPQKVGDATVYDLAR